MSILVVGSVAFDTIETPKGKRDRCLGGAATYFALAASYFTDVRVIAVVGEDFTAEHEAVLTRRGVDTQGLEHTAGKSFHWTGSYVKSLNEAQTLNTELNVFEQFQPRIPAEYQDSKFLFLANIHPDLQAEVRRSFQEIAQIADEERQVHGVDFANEESGVVQQRRKRVRDGVADDAKYLRLAIERVSAIEMLHFLKGDLPRSGCRGYRRISQRTTFTKSEETRWKAHFAHGDRDTVL